MSASDSQIKNIIVMVIVALLSMGAAHALPVCDFFTQKEITQAHQVTGDYHLKDVYIVNVTQGMGRAYRTLIFNADCKMLYDRKLDGIPLAIFNSSEASNVVFITEATGSAYRANAYLIEQGHVKPLITNMGSRSYPKFIPSPNSSTADVVVCINSCGVFRFNNRTKHYYLKEHRPCKICLPRRSPSEQSSAWYPLVRSQDVTSDKSPPQNKLISSTK